MNLIESERQKYEEIWGYDEYNAHSPGEADAANFLAEMNPRFGQSVIDIGCGAGKAGLKLRDFGLDVSYLDITGRALKPEVDRSKFIEGTLWGRWKGKWDYGYCCDVMEHIPTEFVMLVADRIVKNCKTTWFRIANLDENFSGVYGKQLHLTVRPFSWWKERLAMVGNVVDARDLCGVCMFVVKQ